MTGGGDDVSLAPLGDEHAPAMLRWMQDPEVAENLGLRAAPSLERTRRWIAAAADSGDTHAFAILHAGRHVGNVVLDRVDAYLGTARYSVYLGEAAARGRGVAHRATRLLLDRAFGPLGLHKVWLTVHAANGRAVASYARLGFRVEGVLREEFLLRGRREDALYMGVLRRDLAPWPAP